MRRLIEFIRRFSSMTDEDIDGFLRWAKGV